MKNYFYLTILSIAMVVNCQDGCNKGDTNAQETLQNPADITPDNARQEADKLLKEIDNL